MAPISSLAPVVETDAAAERASWRPAARFRASKRRRAAALVLALLVEALLVLILLLAGSGGGGGSDTEERPLSTFDVASAAPEPTPDPATPEQERTSETAEVEQAPVAQARVTPPAPPLPVNATPPPAVPLPSVIELPSEVAAAADLRKLPPSPPPRARGPSGPPAPRGESDTPLVDGSGPNGERLYAASWYREPYDSELRGYLSTAQPGWALIACRTVEEFRVEDCIAVDEWPSGSQLSRAVLAAAWQFKVRPPRVGGRVKVGEWVRIRIDYGIERKRSWR